jgi:dynactin complex subunit
MGTQHHCHLLSPDAMADRLQVPDIGARIALNSHIGIVRFVGQVDNTTGTWIGVEWDDPTRGKHDGYKNGKRYFSCR